MRIAYALIFLFDKIIQGLDLDEYFSPSHGILPLSVGRNHKSAIPCRWTLFELFPESDTFLWLVYYVGVAHGLFLLAGIAPRLQMIGIMVNLISFHNHNYLMWDAQDVALRVWGFLLLFLPLHHVSIYDLWFKNDKNGIDDSWPMWPFRLWQIQVVCAYMGASLGKLDGPAWIEGLAMYRITHTNDFFPGIFNPDFLFNRVLPSKLITWMSLFIELTCFLTVWVPILRIPTLTVVFFFHVGIDLAMNMHTFEWSSILAWASFLVQSDPNSTKRPGLMCKSLGNAIVVGALFVFWADPLPVEIIHNLTPEDPSNYMSRTLHNVTWAMAEYQQLAYDRIHPLLAVTGIEQGYWNMYSGWPDDSNCRLDAIIRFRDGTNDTWTSPNWLNKTWLERKRYARVMDYYENIEQQISRAAWESLCFYLARKYGSDVRSVDLGKYSERSVYPLPQDYNHGWFQVLRQFPMKQSKRKQLWFITNDEGEFARKGSRKSLLSASPSSSDYGLGNQTSASPSPFWTPPTLSLWLRQHVFPYLSRPNSL